MGAPSECFLPLMQHMHYTEVQGCSQQRMQISSCKVSSGQSNNVHLEALLPYVPAIQGSPEPCYEEKPLRRCNSLCERPESTPVKQLSGQDVTVAGETC